MLRRHAVSPVGRDGRRPASLPRSQARRRASPHRFDWRCHARTDGTVGVNLVLPPSAIRVPTEDHLAVCLGTDVDVVSLSFGATAPYVERLHDAGARVIQTVSSAAEAAGAGVDAAALALGADGAWLGTRFLAAEGADVAPVYREEVLEAAETDTLRAQVFDGDWPGTYHRTLRNSTVERWEAVGRPPPGERPGEGEVVGRRPDGRSLGWRWLRSHSLLAVPFGEAGRRPPGRGDHPLACRASACGTASLLGGRMVVTRDGLSTWSRGTRWSRPPAGCPRGPADALGSDLPPPAGGPAST